MTLDTGEEQGKLFVGGLSWETTVEKLNEYFCRYGEVGDCVVMKNAETGRSRGFGFVTFKDASCVLLVLSSGPHQLDGRTIDPKSCNAKGAQKGKREAKQSNFPKVFLGGLPPDVNETTLREYFSKFGKVIEVVIMYDQERKKTKGNGFRGFGFLSFENDDAVNNVVSEHYVTINGKKVEVKRAEPRDKTSPIPAPPLQSNPQLQPAPPSGQPPANWWPGHPPHVAAHPQPVAPYPPGPPSWGATVQVPYGPAAWTPPAPGYQGYPAWVPSGYPGFPSQAWQPSQGFSYGTAYPTNYPGYGQPGVNPPTPMATGPPQPPVPGSTPVNGYGSHNPMAVGPPAGPVIASLPPNPSVPSQPGPPGPTGSYAQDASTYGPARLYGYAVAPASSGYPSHSYPTGDTSSNPGSLMGATAGIAGPAPAYHQRIPVSGQVQGFHPYRRV